MAFSFIRQFLEKSGLRKPDRFGSQEDMADVRMIVGLGNPGHVYDRTRHNAGFDVIDAFSRTYGIEVKKKKFGGLIGDGMVCGQKVLLVKPQLFMNRSGQVVATAAGFYRLDLENLIVVTDDMALEPGRIRIRPKGSSGGHNGLSDISAKLGSQDYARLRVGIGKSERIIARDYVLGKPSPEEKDLIASAVEKSKKALECWISEGIDSAMNKFNVR